MNPLDPEVLARLKELDERWLKWPEELFGVEDVRSTFGDYHALLTAYEEACREIVAIGGVRDSHAQLLIDYAGTEENLRSEVASLQADVARLRAKGNSLAEAIDRFGNFDSETRVGVALAEWERAALAQTSPSASQTSSDEWLRKYRDGVIEECAVECDERKALNDAVEDENEIVEAGFRAVECYETAFALRALKSDATGRDEKEPSDG